MWELGWSLHRMKAENTPQSHLGDQRGRGPREKLCFVQEFCAENCTPRSTWSCKTQHHCKHKACSWFFPLVAVQKQQPRPPKGLHHSWGSRMPACALAGRSATLSDLRRGGKQFYFPSLSKFPLGFYIPHWQTASRSGQGVPKPVLLGRVRRYKGLFGTRGENWMPPLARTLLLPPKSHQRWWIQLQVFVKEGLELHTSWTWVKGTRVSIFHAFLIQFWIFAWE